MHMTSHQVSHRDWISVLDSWVKFYVYDFT